MRKKMRVCLPIIRAGVDSMIAYRLNFLAFFVGSLMYCFIMYFIWLAVFHSSGGSSFMGFSMPDLVTYVFITNLTGFAAHSGATRDVGEQIKDGSFSMLMIKPIGFDTYALFQEIGSRFIVTLLLLPPVVIGVEWYRCWAYGHIVFNLATFLLYFLSIILSYLLSFYFSLSVGFLAFFLKNIWGFSMLKQSIVNFLSGAIIPIAFMPLWAQNILNCLPFASLSYTPVMIYMGKYGPSQTALLIALQVFWVLAFWGLSRLIWQLSVKHVTVQGG
ncbi:MAG TPA: ABC-2 family transporter protein [Caproicibacter sp.]|nr:ABC-2 family transporter protein [Caproicibacter sp.]